MRNIVSSVIGRFATLVVTASLALSGFAGASPASAQARAKNSLPLVRDAEIESLVGDYARPLLKAAGLSRAGVQTVLVNSSDFNAFVLGRRIFVNTGAITMTETPNQLIGILAHEIGHLAGGHQQRLRERLESAKVMAIAAALLERHGLARAKIAAYAGGMNDVRRLFAKDPRSLPALYGDAIATFLSGQHASALKKMDALIAARPSNPWFHEMRGEILLEAGRAPEAVAAFKRAAKLDGSNSGLLQAEIGQALVMSGGKSDLNQAIEMIQAGLQNDPVNGEGYRYLAMAYSRLGDIGRAELATAEGHWNVGSLQEAKVFAARAQSKLKPGTPAFRRAQDILSTKTR